ncbi:MaoC family dehydratase [Sulfobacillus harzensis]|uniref:MaoC family dehydratase n=1 Tax=Sulfobacillus harzensis TaxID=2729629 RepID=A0A7Y0L3L8_9FIRM|nr:MaoC family dehydratase [Sulfobacillus harzensis]NMP22709.1 MaoC family dehydratase [Sulfobacillus harzensis]
MYFEEFRPGTAYTLRPIEVTEQAILQFASVFDPQRIHLDPEFARKGPFGGLIASGYHTLSWVWSRWIEANVLGDESMGGPGLDRVEWLAPVRPGDTLTTVVTITSVRRSKSRPRGIVSMHFEVVNQDGTRVMAYDAAALVRLRPEEEG